MIKRLNKRFFVLFSLVSLASCLPNKETISWQSSQPISAVPASATFRRELTVGVSGGVLPYAFDWPDPGLWTQSDSLFTLKADRPWKSGIENLQITDKLGNSKNISINLLPGVFELGAGIGTTTHTLNFEQDAAGNTYLYGYTTGNLGGAQYGVHGAQDIFVAKINPTGALDWVNQFGGGSATYSQPTSFLLDTAGNTFLYGATPGDLAGTQYGVHSAQDVFIAKINPTGALDWVSQFGGGSGLYSQPISFLLDTAGNTFLYGLTPGDFAGTQYGVHGNEDVFIAKINSTGTLDWVSQLGAGDSFPALPTSFLQDTAGNTFLYGGTPGDMGGTQLGNKGITNTFIAKINSSGALDWVSQLGAGGSSNTDPTSFLLDAVGNTFLYGGTSGNLGGTQLGVHGFQDVFIAKIDSSGGLSWVDQLGTDQLSIPTNILLDNVGNLFLYGDTEGDLGGQHFGEQGRNDAFIAKLDPSGALDWLGQLGGGVLSGTNSKSLLRDTAGNLFFYGVTTGNLGGMQLGAQGSFDVFLAKISSSGALDWVSQLGGGTSFNTNPISFSQDMSGNTFLYGFTAGDVAGTQLGLHGANDVFLAKINPLGSLSWINQLGGGVSSPTSSENFLQDAAGDTFLYGNASVDLSNSINGYNTPSHGSLDVFLIKIDSSGIYQ